MSPRPSQAESLRESFASLVRDLGLLRPEPGPPGQDLSSSEAHALTELAEAGTLSQQELAERVGLQKSTVSRLTDQLVERGWAKRVPHQTDGRSVTVQLTAKGRRRAERSHDAARARFAEVLAALPAADRRTAVQGLALLRDAARRLED